MTRIKTLTTLGAASQYLESTRMISWTSVLVAVAAVSVTSAQTYTNRWDNIDVEPILRNERLLKTYFRCLMDQGKCSPEATELKKNIPDALESGCSKCTDKQRAAVEKVMNHMFNKRQDLFKQLEAKYDPSGRYRARYTQEAESLGYQVNDQGLKKIPAKQ